MEILEELIASSSSSSSDDEYLMCSSIDNKNFYLESELFERVPKNRVKNFVDDVVKKYTDEEFRRNFRVSRDTANKLIEEFRNSSFFKNNRAGRKTVTAESQCLCFLWFAGNKETYREVANMFNVTQSAAYRHLNKFLDFLYDISDQHIRFPTTESEKLVKSKEFEELAGFPNVIGCIDGCYIYIRKPVNKVRSTYVNRHGLISITLQGICDANKKFTDVFIGSPSKIHDARIYNLSYISEKIPSICGEQYHIIGDAAYPLREFLLTPYKDYGNLTSQRSKYNRIHCQTRVKVENTFGLLKQRFRQLIRLDFFTIERMCKFVLGCCVLHNLCIEDGDVWDEIDMPEEVPVEPDNSTNATNINIISQEVLKHLGELKRNAIADNMF